MLAQEGQQAFEAKKYGVAFDRFSRADALVHAPTLLLGLARAQVGLGRLVEAQETYNRILREGVEPNAPKAWTKALADANTEVEAISPRLGWVTITVLGPTNPEVVIDSTPVPPASLGTKRPINPGVHKFRVGAEGFVPSEKSVTVSEGQTIAVNLELEQLPAEPAPAKVAAAPAEESSAPPDSISLRKTLGFVALGVGGAGLIVGSVTGLMAMSKYAKIAEVCPNGTCPWNEDQTAAINNYYTVANVSTAGYIAGGIGVAAGAVLLLTLPASPDPNAAQLTPYLGLGGGGVRGTF